MKKAITLLFIFSSLCCIANDSTRVKKIDSLVSLINNSSYFVFHDTISQDQPQFDLKMKTYLTSMSDKSELKKYVNNVHIIRKENGAPVELITSSAFYFDKGQLIKVEEFGLQNGKRQDFLWYYSGDTCIYYTALKEKSVERAEFLLKLSKGYVSKFNSKLKN